ncbi:MAG: 4Fe-4S binding protein, partial [Halanaerobiales bacterium]
SQGDTQYEIDADLCIDCGACAEVCPVDAISAQ